MLKVQLLFICVILVQLISAGHYWNFYFPDGTYISLGFDYTMDTAGMGFFIDDEFDDAGSIYFGFPYYELYPGLGTLDPNNVNVYYHYDFTGELDYMLFVNNVPYVDYAYGLEWTGEVKFTNNGWIITDTRIYNPFFTSYFFPIYTYSNLGCDDDCDIGWTSSYDTFIDYNDIWVTMYDYYYIDASVTYAPGYNYYLYLWNYDQFYTGFYMYLPPFSERHLVVAWKMWEPLEYSYQVVRAALSSSNAFLFYRYNRVPLLNFMSYYDLAYTTNWNFLAGVGGDPHGKDILGADIEFPLLDKITNFCLHHDSHFQINIEIKSSFITKVVVYYSEGVFYATLDSHTHEPNYFLNDEKLSIPSNEIESGIKITVFDGTSHKFAPLNELGRYQTNKVSIQDQVFITSGYHPKIEGFFNIAVLPSATDEQFQMIPNILNNRANLEKDDHFSNAVIPNIWFTDN